MQSDDLLTKLTAGGQVMIGTDEAQRTQMGKPFPLVISPAEGAPKNFIACQEFLIKNHKDVLKAASEYGTVMFSGWDIASGEEWSSCLNKTSIHHMDYIGGAAVRNLIVGNEKRFNDIQVLTTNESPPSEPIPFHHELAQTPNPCDYICFYCRHNDATGGSTPLIRSDMVFKWLMDNHPETAKKFEELGVRYIKVCPEENDPTSALGRSWKASFNNAQTHEQAEAEMAKQGTTCEWLPNGDCKTVTQTLPAVRVSSNGSKTFFNQVVAAYTGWIDSRNDCKKAVVFGDGSYLPDAVMMELAAYMDDNKCAYRWVPGKWVIVDNTVTFHSRQVFKGRRLAYAGIGRGSKPVVGNHTHLSMQSGDRLPQVGLGLWKIPKDVCAETVYQAIKCGYRLLDSASDYGNEVEVGQGIARALQEGLCKREDLTVVSKLWNTDHRPENVRKACKKTMADLGLDYLDLYLIHFPVAFEHVPIEERYPAGWMRKEGDEQVTLDHGVKYEDTWHAMEALVNDELVKNIGIANCRFDRVLDVVKYAKIKPAVLQVEMHPFLPQENLMTAVRELGIQVMAFSNLGNLGYIELNMATAEDSALLAEPVIKLAEKYGKKPAQIVLRWGIQRGTCIIPKTSKVERLAENHDLFDFQLSLAEMESITALSCGKRYNDPSTIFKGCPPLYQ